SSLWRTSHWRNPPYRHYCAPRLQGFSPQIFQELLAGPKMPVFTSRGVSMRKPLRLSLAKCPNGLLQGLHAGEPQSCGRGVKASMRSGQRGNTLALTVRLPGHPRKISKYDILHNPAIIRRDERQRCDGVCRDETNECRVPDGR